MTYPPGNGPDPYGQRPGHGAPGYGPTSGSPTGPYGYSQPGMPPGAPRRRPYRGLLALLGSAVAVLALGIIVESVLVVRGGGNPTAHHGSASAGSSPTAGAGSPADAVDTYLTAIFTDKSADEAKSVVCRDHRNDSSYTDPQSFDDSLGTSDYTISWTTPKVTSNNGQTAKLTNKLKVKVSGYTQTVPVDMTWTVVQESGWKVCYINASS